MPPWVPVFLPVIRSVDEGPDLRRFVPRGRLRLTLVRNLRQDGLSVKPPRKQNRFMEPIMKVKSLRLSTW